MRYARFVNAKMAGRILGVSRSTADRIAKQEGWLKLIFTSHGHKRVAYAVRDVLQTKHAQNEQKP